MPATRRARLAGLVTTLGLLVGGLAAAPAHAEPAGPAATEVRAAAARLKPLTIKSVEVSCECGGAGYLWGWRTLYLQLKGARDGHRYVAVLKDAGKVTATVYGAIGFASFPKEEFGIEPGGTYSFVVKEYKRKQLVRTSKPKHYTVPLPVAHPSWASIDTVDVGDHSYLVAGRTHTVSYDGAWEDGASFAKGVDTYVGADGEAGYYWSEGYPLPWTEGASDPSLTLSPTAEQVGQTWNVTIVGSRTASDGRPAAGSEWGFVFTLEVISEAQAQAIESAER